MLALGATVAAEAALTPTICAAFVSIGKYGYTHANVPDVESGNLRGAVEDPVTLRPRYPRPTGWTSSCRWPADACC